jgi:hypothetical protein
MLILGPVRPRTNDNRLAEIAVEVLVPKNEDGYYKLIARPPQPTKTAVAEDRRYVLV